MTLESHRMTTSHASKSHRRISLLAVSWDDIVEKHNQNPLQSLSDTGKADRTVSVAVVYILWLWCRVMYADALLEVGLTTAFVVDETSACGY